MQLCFYREKSFNRRSKNRKMKIQSIIYTVLVVALYACEKSPFDYRNKYVGNYNFTNVYSKVDSAGATVNVANAYFGRAKTEGDNKMVVEFESGKSESLRIDQDGNVYNKCETYVGKFDNDGHFNAVLSDQNCLTTDIDGNVSLTISGNRKY